LFRAYGIESVNLREPYGQEYVGNPLVGEEHALSYIGKRFGMPAYDYEGMTIVYWDVHYCHVHSVNLYADGHTSIAYPITRGCVKDDMGVVLGQENFKGHRRRFPQWVKHK
jgi:hypothetical protein